MDMYIFRANIIQLKSALYEYEAGLLNPTGFVAVLQVLVVELDKATRE